MGIALSCFDDGAGLSAGEHQTPALWRGQLGWAPPSGFVDFTLCLNRIAAPLRPDRRRVAAGVGSHTEETLIRCIDVLGLNRQDARLDMADVAARLVDGQRPDALAAIANLSALGLLDLGVTLPPQERATSVLGRRLSLPLSPSRPTLAHVLAHAGRDSEDARGLRLEARFALLRQGGANLNAPSQRGRTPLHIAVLAQNQPALTALIALGADLNARDLYQNTALMLCLRTDFEAGARALLAAGATPEASPPSRTSPQAAAALAHPLPGAQAPMVDAGEDMTALMFAAAAGHTPTLLALIDAGADVNMHTGQSQQTALHVAAREDQRVSIETLVACGAEIDARDINGLTPLHLAAMLGRAHATRALMSLGADINAVGRCGRRPLDLADAAGHSGTLEALLRPASPARRALPSPA